MTATFCLAGWFYHGTRFAAAKAVRAEQTRRHYEQDAQRMNELHTASAQEPDWSPLRPVLDDAIGRLVESRRPRGADQSL